MRTPAQALRDAIASGAVQAWDRGEKIQLDAVDKTGWVFWGGDNHQTPGFSDPDLIWRPAPTKRRIPFTRATVPKGALWNLRNFKWETALEFRSCDVRFSGGDLMTYERIAEIADYSTDGGVTWQPGSMEVDS